MNKTILYILTGIVVVGILAMTTYTIMRSRQSPDSGQTPAPTGDRSSNVTWTETSNGWKTDMTPPACPVPLDLNPPVDISKATSILYPGQVRGGDYKPHGGFRFADGSNDTVTVTAPLDAKISRASRYNEMGEVQYLFEFIAPCGIMYRLDHLRTLSPAFETIAKTLPEPTESSQTTSITGKTVKAGDPIATSVGFKTSGNTSVDWGVYDLRHKNTIAQDTTWLTQHKNNSLAPYGICWLNELSTSDSATVKALPASDAQSGKISDYCK